MVEQAIASAGDEQLDEDARDDAFFYLGELHLIASDFPQAIDCLQRCVELRTETHGPEHWYTGIAATAVAEAYCVYGDYQRAEEQFRRIFESLCGTIQRRRCPSRSDRPRVFASALSPWQVPGSGPTACHRGGGADGGRETPHVSPPRRALGPRHLESRSVSIRSGNRVSGRGAALAQEIYGESHIMTADAPRSIRPGASANGTLRGGRTVTDGDARQTRSGARRKQARLRVPLACDRRVVPRHRSVRRSGSRCSVC